MSNASGAHRLDESLLEAFRYISSAPGKDVRGLLVDCFQLWLNVTDKEKLEQIKEIIGDLHNASLLIDDIEDNSKLRRGNPVAHSIFGVPNVINTANYVYFLALEKCQNLQNPQATKVFVGELLNLHRGQGHDIVVSSYSVLWTVLGYWYMLPVAHPQSAFFLGIPLLTLVSFRSGETPFNVPQKMNILK